LFHGDCTNQEARLLPTARRLARSGVRASRLVESVRRVQANEETPAEISGIRLSATPQKQSQTPTSSDQAQTDLSNIDPANSAAVRYFRQGETMRYSFVIYNPQLDPSTSQPQLQTQVRVFRDGQAVFTGKVQRFALNNPPDITRLSATSAIQLGADMTPDEYVLQVIVNDLLA
jgi:hypothetical protein